MRAASAGAWLTDAKTHRARLLAAPEGVASGRRNRGSHAPLPSWRWSWRSRRLPACAELPHSESFGKVEALNGVIRKERVGRAVTISLANRLN